ncbi:MAG: hypothetical protein DRI69_02130 [Bacteroidetes bacterium]|nr:MAG: hypothetical protein DRI69_02130 [Bacteroidota bacterium]
MIRLFLCFISLVSIRCLTAQVDLDHVSRFASTEILETVRIKKVVEGPYGFVWLATNDGLFRFDGSRLDLMFKGHFEDLDIDQVNSQFVFTSREHLILHKFSGNKTEIILKNALVEGDHILQTTVVINDSTYLVGSSYGLTQYSLRDGAIKSLQLISPDGTRGYVTVAEQDPLITDVVWVGTKSGLYEYHLSSGSYQRHWLNYFKDDRELALNLLDALYIHSDGMIYWGSWGAGLAIYDPITGEYDHLLSEVGNRTNTHVYSIIPESDSAIWISATMGAVSFNPLTGAAKSYLQSDNITDPVMDLGPVMIDKMGRYWIGYVNGLRIHDPNQSHIEIIDCPLMTNARHYIPRRVSFGRNQDLLYLAVDFSEGLYTYNLRNKNWNIYNFEGVKPNKELRIWDALWSGDTLWILERQGLYYYKEGSGIVKEIPLNLSQESYRFRSFATVTKDEFWMSSNLRGIYMAYPSRGELKHYTEIKAFKNHDFLQHVDKLHLDQNGLLWLGYKNHLWVYIPETSHFIDISANVNDGQPFLYLHDFYEDAKGIWLSTYSGVYLIQRTDGDQFESTRITTISTNNVLTDLEGDVWLITERSITKINSHNDLSQRYTKNDGLPNTGRYGYERIDRFNDDRLFLSGRKVFAIFHPNDLIPAPETPQPYFVSAFVDGIETKLHGLGLSLNYLNLEPNQNSVTIDFSAISFSSRINNRFRYKLEGVNEDWVVTGAGSKGPTYVNLQGGDYRFYVEATGTGDNWGAPAIIEIKVGEYWWQKLWVQLLLALLALCMLFVIYRIRIGRMRKQNEIQMQIVDLERKALQAQMNPHFIFNAMNSIQNLVAKSDEKGAIFYLGRFGKLLRSVLDNSNDSYVSLSKELELVENYILLESLRFQGVFKYDIDVDPALDYSDIKIPGFIIQPVVENAIQHGLIPKKGEGELKIALRQNGAILSCIVEDNGVGRQASASSNKNKGGSSVGLKILKSRLELHSQGDIEGEVIFIEDLYSEDGSPSGTRVNIKLPIQN